ncbi:hypothetical protein A7978_04620 (plasmid) [Borrelia turicatae]|uniref:p23-like cell envelope protein n=3 Tax=Borrelia turicatae TaxID=142 RepID=T1ECL8_BORT9|nr:hypothetical protein [Borrelia turicatae]ADN26482.1 p23-like cell envelope protein [Borrelia turicatae 91E135]ANF34397.1 hypothetical protein A7978_04620 [Borrelia turicatae]UPA13981.1 hypothetical protein bt91E135_001144 [Borrelia turicatae 91E135]UPA15474.1 hypothetical protein btBTE5EL_001155 [Borrelia turicatae]
MKKIIILLTLFITCKISQTNKPSMAEEDKTDEHKTNLEHDYEEFIPPKRERIHSIHRAFELFEDYLTNICLQPPHIPLKCRVQVCGFSWIKIKSKHIVGTDKNIIPELKNKIKYSYAVAPIKYNDGYNANITPLILLEIFDANIKITSFKLTNHQNLELDLGKKTHDTNVNSIIQSYYNETRNSILREAKNKIKSYGGQDVYLYGIMNMPTPEKPQVIGSDRLISIFGNLFKNQQGASLQAEITIKDKINNQEKTYQILLSSKIFNEFIKTILSRHKGITNVNPKFKIPGEDK